MLWLCAKDSAGKALWTSFIEEQGLGIGEILALFPSCAPTLAILSANAITLAPRLYSIACSQLRHPCSLSIAFSLVRYTCRVKSGREMASGKSIRRNGLCTHYLKDILFPLLTKDTSMLPTPKVRIFPKASLDFHLPGNTSFPLVGFYSIICIHTLICNLINRKVLIGPGTGVAPFIGFLEHREQLLVERSREGEEVSAGLWRGAFEFEARDLPAEHSRVNDFLLQSTPGFTYLFYGCRNDADFLFRPELEGFLSSKALGCLSVAMSRVDKDKKVYVTHKIRDAGEELTKAILHENAYVFICGDGNSMAKDVNLALQESLMKWGELSESEAVSLLADLKAKKRYVLDVWS